MNRNELACVICGLMCEDKNPVVIKKYTLECLHNINAADRVLTYLKEQVEASK